MEVIVSRCWMSDGNYGKLQLQKHGSWDVKDTQRKEIETMKEGFVVCICVFWMCKWGEENLCLRCVMPLFVHLKLNGLVKLNIRFFRVRRWKIRVEVIYGRSASWIMFARYLSRRWFWWIHLKICCSGVFERWIVCSGKWTHSLCRYKRAHSKLMYFQVNYTLMKTHFLSLCLTLWPSSLCVNGILVCWVFRRLLFFNWLFFTNWKNKEYIEMKQKNTNPHIYIALLKIFLWTLVFV